MRQGKTTVGCRDASWHTRRRRGALVAGSTGVRGDDRRPVSRVSAHGTRTQPEVTAARFCVVQRGVAECPCRVCTSASARRWGGRWPTATFGATWPGRPSTARCPRRRPSSATAPPAARGGGGHPRNGGRRTGVGCCEAVRPVHGADGRPRRRSTPCDVGRDPPRRPRVADPVGAHRGRHGSPCPARRREMLN